MRPVNPYQSIVDLLSNILEAHTTAFFLIDHKNRKLNLVASQSLSRHLNENISLPMEQSGILSQAHKADQVIHLDKLQDVPSTISSTLPFYREGESLIKGLFVSPVGDGLGVLYVDTKYGWGFNDKQQKWIRQVGDLLHEYLKREEALRQQRDYARILELWHRLDHAAFKGCALEDYCQLLVNESAQLLGVEYAFLALKEPGSSQYRLAAITPSCPRNLLNQRFLAKQGLIGRVFQNQKILHIPRLNPESSEHFLFSSAESLPHHGTLWALPARLSLGHAAVLSFLSRKPLEWNADEQHAISHLLHFFQLLLEQFYFKETCEHLQAYDFSTGLLNTLAFESKVDEILAASIQNSTPFTLVLLQVEPWQKLYTTHSPKWVRESQGRLASSIHKAVSSRAAVGQVAENRYGLLFPGMLEQEADSQLSSLADLCFQVLSGEKGRMRLEPYFGAVSFPQDGTRSDELWSLLYHRLFKAFDG